MFHKYTHIRPNKSVAKRYNAYGLYCKYNKVAVLHTIDIATVIVFEEYMKFFNFIKIADLIAIDDKFIERMGSILRRKYGDECFHAFWYIISKNWGFIGTIEDAKEIFRNYDIYSGDEEDYIYNTAKAAKPYLYTALMAKKFSTSKNNILGTLAKIAGDQLVVVPCEDKPIIYVYNTRYWTCDVDECRELLIQMIRTRLYDYYMSEANRVGFSANNLELARLLLDDTFCAKLIKSIYRVDPIGQDNCNIKFNNISDTFHFDNTSFDLYENKFITTTSDNFISHTTKYDYILPSLDTVNKVNQIINKILPNEHERNALLNLCCAALFDMELDIFVILKQGKEGKGKEGKELFLALLKGVLGNYHKVCDCTLLEGKTDVVTTSNPQKQVIIFENFNSETSCVDNEAANKVTNMSGRQGPIFISTNGRPRFTRPFSYAFARKIIEIPFKSTTDNNGDDYKYDEIYACAFFYILVNRIFNNENYKRCSNYIKWYNYNINMVVKKRVRKYGQYNKLRLDKFFC